MSRKEVQTIYGSIPAQSKTLLIRTEDLPMIENVGAQVQTCNMEKELSGHVVNVTRVGKGLSVVHESGAGAVAIDCGTQYEAPEESCPYIGALAWWD